MSVLERISARLGEDVSGSDIKTSGHDKKNISGKDLVVYSGAIPESNEELSYARKLGVPGNGTVRVFGFYFKEIR